MFLHERGGYNTLYFAVYFGAVQLGAIIGGVMSGHVGWRNFFWLNVALLGAVFLTQLFLFPETKWHRMHPRELGTEHNKSVSSPDQTYKIQEPHHTEISDDAEKGQQQKPTHQETDPYLQKGYPAKAQFKLWQRTENPFQAIKLALLTPWKLFAFPIVELSAFIVSFSASMNLTVNFTQAQVFSFPPYNFSAEQVGYTNFAILAGTGLGLLTNGKLSDWVAQRATRKNRGIREPEMRLPAMVPYVLVMLLSNFIIAFGYAKQWNWQVRTTLSEVSYLHLGVC
jgi:MFS family permease